MKQSHLSRRQLLQTAAFAGVAGVVGTIPGVSYAASMDTLKVRFDSDPGNLDPGFYVGGSPPNDVNWAIMPSLVMFAEGGGWQAAPHAESVTVRDAQHIDFTLKKGLMWSGGNGEVTTADVAYSYDRMKTSEWKGYFVAYDHIDIKDKYSGTIVLNQPFSPFMAIALASGTGIILCKKAVEAAGGKFTTVQPATCGPYIISDQRDGQFVKFRPNPDWNGPKPAIANIDCLVVTEDEAAALAFEAGEVQCTKITSNAYARYKKNPPAGSKLTVAGALQYMWMGMNTENPKLKDIRVRKAIQRAINQKSIVEGAYSGTAFEAHGVVCPGLIGHRDKASYSYDPTESKKLLEEAGVSGLKLTLRTLNNQERVLAAQIIQANLAAIGITVEIMPLDSGPFWDMGQESKGDTWKDLELWIMRFGSGPDPYEPFQWFVSSQVGIWNWERWKSDKFDVDYKKLVAETAPKKRAAIADEMQQIMDDTGAYAWLTFEPEVYIHSDKVHPVFAPSAEMELVYFT